MNMSSTSLHYWNEKLPKTQPRTLKFLYDITGAKAISPLVMGVPVLHSFDAIASQAVIDDFLGSTNEFLVAAFDATAMGTDAIAFIIDMKGQAAKVLTCKVASILATGIEDVNKQIQMSAALTASTLETKAALSISGNIAIKAVLTGLDALTDGTVLVEVEWIAK